MFFQRSRGHQHDWLDQPRPHVVDKPDKPVVEDFGFTHFDWIPGFRLGMMAASNGSCLITNLL
jgi:hypothetical protein